MEKILVIRPDRIGDLILALPVASAIKRHLSNIHISMLVSAYAAPVLRHHPEVDAVLTVSDQDTVSSLTERLRVEEFDVALHVFPTPKIALATFLARIPKRIGSIYRYYSPLFNKPIWENRRPSIRHEAEYNISMLKHLGLTTKVSPPHLYLSEQEVQRGKCLIGSAPNPIIILHPGAITNSERNWPLSKYFTLGNQLIRQDYTVVITGVEEEKSLLKDYLVPPFIDLVGKLSLRELMAVIAASDLVISAATGAMHIAASFRIPTISFFTDIRRHHPRRWHPLGNNHCVILPPKVAADFPNNRFDLIRVDEVMYHVHRIIKEQEANMRSNDGDDIPSMKTK